MKQNNQITKRNLFQGETFQVIMPKLAAQVVLFDKLEMNLANKRNMDFMDCKRLLSLMLIPEKPRMNFCIVIVLYWIWFSKAKFEISCFSFSIMIPDHWILLSTNSAALLIFFSDFFQRTTGKSDLSEVVSNTTTVKGLYLRTIPAWNRLRLSRQNKVPGAAEPKLMFWGFSNFEHGAKSL